MAVRAQSTESLMFPKGPTRRAEQTAKRQHRADIIRAVREQVMERDKACRICGSTACPTMHEIISRARLRGRIAENMFNTYNCLRLCGGPTGGCHEKVTRHKVKIVVTWPSGANGPIEILRA